MRYNYPTSNSSVRVAGVVVFSTLCVLNALMSQTAPSPPETETRKSRVPSETEVKTASSKDDDDVLKLSPFVVTPEEDVGYRATTTLAGTRIKTNLRDIGSAISVVTKEFLNDTGAKGNEDLLVYTANTEVGGLSGNFGQPGISNGYSSVQTTPDSVTRIRGLGVADNTRDYFLSDIPWDSYNVDRVEIQRGPNSILYGLGKPGGLVNSNIAQAVFKNAYRLQTRVSDTGSLRNVLDLNQVIIDQSLSVRVVGLDDRTKYQQKPAFSDDSRIFLALRFDPKFLKRGSARTTLRFNFENGTINSNNPRITPPIDRITPWFATGTTTVNGVVYNNLNKQVFDFRYWTTFFPGVPNSGFLSRTSPNYQPGLGTTFGGVHAYYGDQNSAMPTGSYQVTQHGYTSDFGLGANGLIDRTIGGLFGANRAAWIGTADQIATNLRLPFASAYSRTSLTDPSIFDFYNKLLDGPTKHERKAFEANNVTLSQTFLNNRLGFEVALDRQTYNDRSFGTLTSLDEGVTIDVNTLLPDLTPNPNLGRPVIYGRSFFGNGGTETTRSSFRATAFAELRAADVLPKAWTRLAKIFGRHVFTGNASSDDYDRDTTRWASSTIATGSAFPLTEGAINGERELLYTIYLGPDARGQSSASGLHVSNITQDLTMPTGTLRGFDSHWNLPTAPTAVGYVNPAAPWVNPFNNQTLTQSENPANYVGWSTVPATVLSADNPSDLDQLAIVGGRSRDEIRSKVLIWQGFFFGDNLVLTGGYRKDTARSYNVSANLTSAGYRDLKSPTYVLPSKPNSEISGSTQSKSVVLHTPKLIRRRLPGGLDISLFYNLSDNFEPSAGRVDILNRALPTPQGETKDYGVIVSLWDERLSLKVNKYESLAANASFGLPTPAYFGTIESSAWVAAKRFEAGLTGNPVYSGADYNYGTVVAGVFTQSAADRAQQAADVKAVLDNMRPDLLQAWNIMLDENRWQIGAYSPFALGYGGFQPPGMTSTTDALSKGYEMELNFKPVKNWDIALNASKTTAVRTNTYGEPTTQYIEQRNTVWNGPGGRLKTFNGTTSDTWGEQWNNNLYTAYTLQKLLDGSLASQIRPWRFNLITNYRFVDNRFKGLNVGGAYRWEDKVAIGYPSVFATINGAQVQSFDISKPYYGPRQTTVDLWAGYQRRIGKKVTWRLQLNVRNAFGKNELIPISTQPDGTPALYRIKQGPGFTLTNTFSF